MKTMMENIRRSVGVVTVLVMLSNCSIQTTQNSLLDKRPNIILILADDAGYADFGFMGSEDIKTPNLDKLAKDGTVFTDAHVTASVCSPSRAGLLTGRYQQRFGHECNLEPHQHGAFDSSQVTIAEYLSKKGYHTSIFGKWHLGEHTHQHPIENGFDYFWGFLAGGRSYFPNEIQDKIGDSHAILENTEPSSFKGYLTDAIGDQAVNYIERHSGQGNPFFMYLSFNAPHTPMHAKEEVIESFGKGHRRPVYAAMMWSMDEAIGKVVKSLHSHDIYDNTLIFFLSDNGGAHNNNSSVKPFKGWKGNQYEGGTRVPLIASWKKKLPAGKRFGGLTSSMDIYATIVATLDDNESKSNLDGENLIPFIKGKQTGNPHRKLFWRKDEMATVRLGSYKYITLQDTISVLYDLSGDLLERQNLVSEKPRVTDSLKQNLRQWNQELIAPLWLEPENWNRVTRRIYSDLMQNHSPLVKDLEDLKKLDMNKQ